jgi:ATP/ADP translocase
MKEQERRRPSKRFLQNSRKLKRKRNSSRNLRTSFKITGRSKFLMLISRRDPNQRGEQQTRE